MKTKPTTATIQTENPTATAPAQDPTVRTEQPSLNDESVFNGESKSNAQTNGHGITAAEATDRPDLYAGTYWGCFCLARNPDIGPDIIANRNQFAKDARLKCLSRAVIQRPPTWSIGLDHLEIYKDMDGYYRLVASNYGDNPPPAVMNMKPIPPMYSPAASSYSGRYATNREINVRLEAAVSGDGGPKFGAARHLFTEPPTPRRKRGRRPTKATN